MTNLETINHTASLKAVPTTGVRPPVASPKTDRSPTNASIASLALDINSFLKPEMPEMDAVTRAFRQQPSKIGCINAEIGYFYDEFGMSKVRTSMVSIMFPLRLVNPTVSNSSDSPPQLCRRCKVSTRAFLANLETVSSLAL
jgi:hypothetical protein